MLEPTRANRNANAYQQAAWTQAGIQFGLVALAVALVIVVVLLIGADRRATRLEQQLLADQHASHSSPGLDLAAFKASPVVVLPPHEDNCALAARKLADWAEAVAGKQGSWTEHGTAHLRVQRNEIPLGEWVADKADDPSDDTARGIWTRTLLEGKTQWANIPVWIVKVRGTCHE